jgi:hypothetical protein
MVVGFAQVALLCCLGNHILKFSIASLLVSRGVLRTLDFGWRVSGTSPSHGPIGSRHVGVCIDCSSATELGTLGYWGLLALCIVLLIPLSILVCPLVNDLLTLNRCKVWVILLAQPNLLGYVS